MMASPRGIMRQQKLARRAKTPSRAKAPKPGQPGRFILQDKELTKSAAKQLTTKAIRGENLSDMGKGGTDLSFSVQKMAERLNVDPEIADKIANMDPDKLQSLYENNDLVFDVFFSYEGVQDHGDYTTIDEDKEDDVLFFVSEYERAFGEL